MELQFNNDITAKSHQKINLCYQCKKCGAGCPVSDIMQTQNYQIIRLIQRNERERVLSSNTQWVCLSCKTCSARCPNGIDVAKILDTLKAEALAANTFLPERKIAIFNFAFLLTLRQFGRMFDLGLIAYYKMMTGTFLQDLSLGLLLIRRGKLKFFPHRIKRIREIRMIFSQIRKKNI